MKTPNNGSSLSRREFLKLVGAAAAGAVLFRGTVGCSSKSTQGQLFSRHYDFLSHFPDAHVFASEAAYVKAGEVISVAGEGRFCLFEHPPAEVVFSEVPVYQEGELQFGVGMHEDTWEQSDDGVHFIIEAVDQSGRTHTLYERHVDPRQHAKDRRWFDEVVDLRTFAGQRIQLTFRTEAGGSNRSDWAAWSAPMLVSYERSDAEVRDRPNILFISIDTLRADHLSCYGYPRRTSPTLDRLAREGLRFASAYSQSDITLPSHSTMLTGVHPRTHGVIENSIPLPDMATLPELLRVQGYHSVGVTSAYLLGPPFNIEQDFDDFYACRAIRRPAWEVTDIALEWLIEQAREPFFMWLHYFDPHAPYLPPTPYDKLYSAAEPYTPYRLPVSGVRIPENWQGWYEEDWPPPYEDVAEIITQYDGAITYTDAEIARLLAWLEESGLSDNTLIMVTADHGEGFGEHGVTFGHFGTHDEITHVPLIVCYPPRFPRGEVVDNLVGHMDLAPTLLDLAGLSIPPEMQGQSLLPLLQGKRWTEHEGVFFPAA